MPPNEPLHHDASGGLGAAVVAGERRGYAAQPPTENRP